MSQPVGIVAKVKISEAAYKKFIKQAANEIAEELFYSFWHKSSNVYLFQYNKRQSTLYSFIYYHYGNSETLQESSIYKALHKIEPFLEIDSVGYFFATLDSLNFGNFIAQYKIENQQWKSHEFSYEEISTIWKEASKKFFYRVEDITDYTTFFNNNTSFIDKSILKQFNVIKEAARIRTVREELPNATPLKPVQIYKGYFFNGSEFYYCNGVRKIVCFESIDLQNIEEKDYGLADGQNIIIGEKVIKANSKTFRKYHKFYTTYYKTDNKVYDENLNIIEIADAETFKFTTYKRDISNIYFGEDQYNIYYLGEVISKNDVGTIRFSNDLFYNEALLLGSKQIYLGATLIPEIDAATFEKLHLKGNENYESIKERYCPNNSPASAMHERIYYGKDKEGELFIFRPYKESGYCPFVQTSFGFKNQEIVVLRMNKEEFWEFYKNYRKEIFDKASEYLSYHYVFHGKEPKTPLEFYSQFNSFIQSSNFKAIFEECKYNWNFLMRVNNYLYNCWQLYANSGGLFTGKDKSYLKTGLNFFKSVEHELIAELNPYIFHHLCCFCVALDKLDEAIIYFQKASQYGYPQFHLMLTDNDLKPLFTHPYFIKTKEWFEQYVTVQPNQSGVKWRWTPNPNPYPMLNEECIELLKALPDELKQSKKYSADVDYVSFLMENYFIWDLSDNDDEMIQYRNKIISVIAPYFNRYLQNTIDLSWQSGCAYIYYKDYKITNAKSHLARLEYIYFNAHNEYGIKQMNEDEIKDLIHRIKLKFQDSTEEDKTYIRNSSVLKMLKEQI